MVKKPRLDTTAHISLIDDIDEKNPFTEGNAADEIELKFDEGKSLFVSKSFLSYSSPVFERMFQSAFKERDGTSVDLKEKSYDAFLEMLLFLHPRVQKTIPGEFYLHRKNISFDKLKLRYLRTGITCVAF